MAARAAAAGAGVALAAVVVAGGLVGGAEGAYGFLGMDALSRGRRAQRNLAEVAAVLGHGGNSSEARLQHFEDQMRPTFATLPKRRDGGVDQGVARYALHRFFLAHRAWHIRGLAPDGQRWSASTSTAMLRSKLPDSILALLDERVGHAHIGLRELALLAATVEDLVHSDTLELLLMAYETHGLAVEQAIQDEEQLNRVVQTYMVFFLLPWTQDGRDHPEEINDFLREGVADAYPGWGDTILWMEDLKEVIRYRDRGARSPFGKSVDSFGDFVSLARLVEETVNGIGMFQDIECREIKNRMLALDDENRNDGRIPLNKYYRGFYANESFWFTESPEYLRHLGALDESDPDRLTAIVPNVVYSRANCLATSGGFHSLCCVNECDLLMEALERSIGKPAASSDEVAKLVAALPSDTVAAPRNLSGTLRRKLGSIAARNGGGVPLHGRIFAQWMHHAFPNECPFPRSTGILEAPLTHDEFADLKNLSSRANEGVMKQFIDLANATTEGAADDEPGEASIKWFEEEELLITFELEAPHWGARLGSALRLLAMAVAALATVAVAADSFQKARSMFRQTGLKGAPSTEHPEAVRKHVV